MAPVSLKNVKISTIKPYTKTEHPAIVEPSIFDLTAIDAYVPVVFFYKPEERQAETFINLVERIKESLSKVLVPYFPMAGRWLRTYDARIRELDCNDEGVIFIEASIDEKLEFVVNVNDFVAMELLSGYHFVGLDPKVFSQVDVETPLPSLFVQATQFKCGSVALNITFCHMAADGYGMSGFLLAWSEIALHGQTSIVPIHDRSLTVSVVEFMRSALGDAGGRDVVEPENVNTEKVDANTRRVDPGLALVLPSEATSNKTLHMRRKVILDLKREAALQNMNVTTMDLIAAHFWRSIHRFPESLDGKTSSVVATTVDGRSRYHNPPISERYFGNVILTCSTPQAAASDLAADNSPLVAANIVHNSLGEIDPSNWQTNVLRLLEELRDFPNLEYRMLIITNWLRFPMYEINFGQGFGKPFFASANFTFGLMPYGFVIVQPPPPSLADTVIASIQVVITSDEAATTLFSDAQFRSFFLPFEMPISRL